MTSTMPSSSGWGSFPASPVDLAHGPGSGSHSGSGGSGGGGSGADGRGSPSFRGSEFSSGRASTASDGPSLVWRGSDGGTVSSGPGGGSSGSGSGSGSSRRSNRRGRGKRRDKGAATRLHIRARGRVDPEQQVHGPGRVRARLAAGQRPRSACCAWRASPRRASRRKAARRPAGPRRPNRGVPELPPRGRQQVRGARRAQYQEITYELGAKVRACVRGSTFNREGAFQRTYSHLTISLFASFASFLSP